MTDQVKVHITYVRPVKEPVYYNHNRKDRFINALPTNIQEVRVIDRDYSRELFMRLVYVMRYQNDHVYTEFMAQAVCDLLNHSRGLSPYQLQRALEIDDTTTLELLEILYQFERDVVSTFAPNVPLRDVMYYIDPTTKTLLIIVRR
jgi:hypothetical protein